MKRLTREDNINIAACMSRLKQIEDYEEKFGIDVLIIMAALDQGVYYKSPTGRLYSPPRESDTSLTVYGNKKMILNLRDITLTNEAFKTYGKEWALTKEAFTQ